jgi:hypothetical protein
MTTCRAVWHEALRLATGWMPPYAQFKLEAAAVTL